EPETEGIQARECHVSSPDHQWDEVVCESEQHGHSHKENHGGAMHREHAVKDLWGDKSAMRVHQLDADDDGLDPSNYKKEERVDDVQNSQFLVINRGQPLVKDLDPGPIDNLRARNHHCIR